MADYTVTLAELQMTTQSSWQSYCKQDGVKSDLGRVAVDDRVNTVIMAHSFRGRAAVENRVSTDVIAELR